MAGFVSSMQEADAGQNHGPCSLLNLPGKADLSGPQCRNKIVVQWYDIAVDAKTGADADGVDRRALVAESASQATDEVGVKVWVKSHTSNLLLMYQ